MIDFLISLFLVSGGFFVFVAGLGILKMPDTLIRMHASTKAGTLGIGLILLSLSFYFQELTTSVRAIAILMFIVLTAPVAAHLIGRAAYRSGVPLHQKTKISSD